MTRTTRLRTVAVVLGLGLALGLVAPTSASAATTLTAVSTVNIRSAASATSRVLGNLDKGQKVTASSTRKGWTAISFAGGRAYVASKYLSKSTKIAVSVKVTTGSVRSATAAVNVRRGAGTSYAIRSVLPNGAAVTMTGKTSRGYGQVVTGRTTGWASLAYLASIRGVLPAAVDTRVATADLSLRTSSTASARVVGEVSKGTEVSITGVTAGGRAQIVYGGAARWVTAKYLATTDVAQPAPPSLPEVTGTRYATATLNIRSSPEDDYTLIAEVPAGTALSITGVVTNERMQIVFQNAARWVTAQYLSKTPPAAAPAPGKSSVEKGLKPNAIKVYRTMLERYPQITTYYGVRPDSIPDHPSGRALDAMIPNYTSAAGKALGSEAAAWLRANAEDLGIQYIIWNQHIWNIQRDSEGWRYMADRGGDSANHKNHVHITVYG